MPKVGYKSKLAGAKTFARDVCIDGEFDRRWQFVEGENADFVVREWADRIHGPGHSHTIVVADPDSDRPMRDRYPGMMLP